MNLWIELKRKFGPPTLLQLAVQELEEAERKKMAAHTGQEYATAMIAYETARIKRLKQQINELSKESKK